MKILKEKYAVCKLPIEVPIPQWALKGEFSSVTKTMEENSVVCVEKNIPKEVQSERNWRIIKIEGPLEFTMIGVLAEISQILAKENISIFVISTSDTDYILVKEKDLRLSKEVLRRSNYTILE